MYTNREIALELLDNSSQVKSATSEYLKSRNINVPYSEYILNKYLGDIKDKYLIEHISRGNYVSKHDSYSVRATTKGYHKMIFTKYFTTFMDKIPKGSNGFFLGSRHTSMKVINDSMNHYGLKYISKNYKSADFFIIGNNLTNDDISIIRMTGLPMVMDDELRVDSYFSVYNNTSIKEVDNSKFTTIFRESSYDNLKMICDLIKYVDRDALSNITKFRLLRLFTDIFHRKVTSRNYSRGSNITKSIFNVNNKEHIYLSDTVQRYCIPHLRYYVTSSYLKNSKSKFVVSDHLATDTLLFGEWHIFPQNSYYSTYLPQNILPKFEGIDTLYIEDAKDNTKDSLGKMEAINELTDYAKIDLTSLWSNDVTICMKLVISNSFSKIYLNLNIIHYVDTGVNKLMDFSNSYSNNHNKVSNDLSLAKYVRSNVRSGREVKNWDFRNPITYSEEDGIMYYNEMYSEIKDFIESLNIDIVDTKIEDILKDLSKLPFIKTLLNYSDDILRRFNAYDENYKLLNEIKLDKRKNYLNNIIL